MSVKKIEKNFKNIHFKKNYTEYFPKEDIIVNDDINMLQSQKKKIIQTNTIMYKSNTKNKSQLMLSNAKYNPQLQKYSLIIQIFHSHKIDITFMTLSYGRTDPSYIVASLLKKKEGIFCQRQLNMDTGTSIKKFKS